MVLDSELLKEVPLFQFLDDQERSLLAEQLSEVRFNRGDVNLKAELEITHLHEKVDRLTSDVLLRLDRLQRRMDSSTGKPGNRS
jgi:uncharacterized membrane protein